jgi:hypothetical protein
MYAQQHSGPHAGQVLMRQDGWAAGSLRSLVQFLDQPQAHVVVRRFQEPAPERRIVVTRRLWTKPIPRALAHLSVEAIEKGDNFMSLIRRGHSQDRQCVCGDFRAHRLALCFAQTRNCRAICFYRYESGLQP